MTVTIATVPPSFSKLARVSPLANPETGRGGIGSAVARAYNEGLGV